MCALSQGALPVVVCWHSVLPAGTWFVAAESLVKSNVHLDPTLKLTYTSIDGFLDLLFITPCACGC